jgi:putative transcriptional regulator
MPRRRDYFGLLETGAAAKERHTRKQMLRDWDAVRTALPEVDAEFIRETREKLNCSRALFARRLCMNERTLEKWEQARAKPNAQASVLLLLVRHFPDTLERLRRIANADPSRSPEIGK